MTKNISIIGGGTSGSFTANYLAKNFPGKKITWYIPKDNNIIGVGEATIPDVLYFLKDLDISIDDIIKKCDGTLKLGIKFINWLGNNDYYFHQFGGDLEEACVIKLMCTLEKIPIDISKYEIALHFDTKMLSSFLIKKASSFKNIKIVRQTPIFKSKAYELSLS